MTHKLFILAGFTALAVSSPMARAAEIVQAANCLNGCNLTFDAFDTSLGTLTGVSFGRSVVGFETGILSSALSGKTVTFSAKISGVLTAGSIVQPFSLASFGSQFASAGVPTDLFTQAFGTPINYVDPFNLNKFAANNVSIHVDPGIYTLDPLPSGYSWNRLSGGLASSYVSLAYEYTAASVPEPAAWGLMVMGIGAVGLRLRARRRPALRAGYA